MKKIIFTLIYVLFATSTFAEEVDSPNKQLQHIKNTAAKGIFNLNKQIQAYTQEIQKLTSEDIENRKHLSLSKYLSEESAKKDLKKLIDFNKATADYQQSETELMKSTIDFRLTEAKLNDSYNVKESIKAYEKVNKLEEKLNKSLAIIDSLNYEVQSLKQIVAAINKPQKKPKNEITKNQNSKNDININVESNSQLPLFEISNITIAGSIHEIELTSSKGTKTYLVGDYIDGWVITKIQRDGVYISKNNKNRKIIKK